MPKLFLTVSPPPRPGRVVHQYLDDVVLLRHALRKIKRWVIYPELDKKGRLHYHGILNCTDHEYVSYYRVCLPTLEKIGFIQTSRIDSFMENLRTVVYCQKQFALMKQLLWIEEPLISFSVKTKKGLCRHAFQEPFCFNTFETYGFTRES